MSTGFVALLLFAPAAEPSGLQKGDELMFAGTVVENDNRPSKLWHREYKLSICVFVLERQENWVDAAVLTRLVPVEDAVGGLTKPVTGAGLDKNAPPIIQLDIVRFHSDGTAHLLLPPDRPFRLTADTPARALAPMPLNSHAPSELSIFPPRIPRSNTPGDPWTVAAGADRPNEIWAAKKLEFVNAEQCQLLAMNQQSPDWDKPVGGQLGWQRAESVWVSTEDGTARRVRRVIQQRVGLSKDPALNPALRVLTEYELKGHEKLGGHTYDRTRSEVEIGFRALADTPFLVKNAKTGPRMLESRIAQLDGQLEETAPGTPFREAIVAARRTLDAARRGDVPLPILPAANAAPVRVLWPEAGQTAPDFRTGNIQLSDLKGRAVVLVFFRPSSETTDLALAIADALQKRYGEKLVVLALVTAGEPAAAIQDRNRLKLTIAIREGIAVAAAYGVESFPRFALIEPEGKVRWTFTGVGAETGYLLKEQVDRLARPTLPNGPGGITASPGPATPPPSPRP